MTLQITSLEHGKEIGAKFLKLVSSVNRNCSLAGGWFRDVASGVQPKDMDFFLTAPPGPLDKTIEEAGKIYALIGHEFQQMGHIPVPGGDAGYPRHMTVFESTKVPEGDHPVQLVYTSHDSPHPLSFDLAICNCYMYMFGDEAHMFWSREYTRDMEEKTITVLRARDAWLSSRAEEDLDITKRRLRNHIERVQAKFPDHRVLVNWTFPDEPNAVEIYDDLVEGGFIGDPRQVLPPEGQVTDWDEVRQQNRAEGLGEVERATAQRLFNEDIATLLETRATAVPDPAQVQPGPATPRGRANGRTARRAGRGFTPQPLAADLIQPLDADRARANFWADIALNGAFANQIIVDDHEAI